MVCAEKLKSENNFIFSEHTDLTRAIIDFFTKSPLVNGFLSFAINFASPWWCDPRPCLGWVEMAAGFPEGPNIFHRLSCQQHGQVS